MTYLLISTEVISKARPTIYIPNHG